MKFFDRDLSWLSFNYRVLMEAMDKSVPLLERLKFIAIYSSNLDEFFRVRVANHTFRILGIALKHRADERIRVKPKQKNFLPRLQSMIKL